MKLYELIDSIDEVDDDLIIFLKDNKEEDSEIVLLHPQKPESGISKQMGQENYYLIEVFLAKEFIEDWKAQLSYLPSQKETARRLYEYAVNDA